MIPYFILELEMIFKGSDAAERKGIYYVISDVDHPATTLLQSPNKLNKGMAAKIGLSLKKVRGRPLMMSKFFEHFCHLPPVRKDFQ
jgi:hypothetical protein